MTISTLHTGLRAGRVLASAILTRSGPRERRSGAVARSVALIGAVVLGAGAGAAVVGADGTAGPVPAAERARIEAIVRDYILAHPEIIPEAMERMRDRDTARAIADSRAQLERPYAGAWDGAADGDVVLVEFFDYACGYCRAAAPDVARLLAGDKRLKIVYRELPILGEESVVASRVALLAADSGQYRAFHKAMYDGEGVDKSAILAAATTAGLDRAKVQSILGSRGTAEEFANNIALAQALGARGTPMFVVGDQILHGDVGYDALKAAVDKTRASNKKD